MTAMGISGIGKALAQARALSATLTKNYLFQEQSEKAELVLIDGSGDWPAEATAALQHSPTWLVLLNPELREIAAIKGLQEALKSSETQLVFSETAPNNPALPAWHESMPTDVVALTLQTMGSTSAQQLLFQQLRIVRALGFTVDRVTDRLANDSAAIVTAIARRGETETLLRLSALTTAQNDNRHQVDAYSAEGIASICLPQVSDARPAHASIMDASGERIQPTIYEHAHRATLRAIANGEAASGSLIDFVRDILLSQIGPDL